MDYEVLVPLDSVENYSSDYSIIDCITIKDALKFHYIGNYGMLQSKSISIKEYLIENNLKQNTVIYNILVSEDKEMGIVDIELCFGVEERR